MNLIVDAGNTYVKIAIFKAQDMLVYNRLEKKDLRVRLEEVFQEYPEIKKIITSSVTKISKSTMDFFKENRKEVITLSHQTNVPFTNLYSTPTTLGVDRIALIAAAVSQYPNQNVLVIDAGTCITFDFKTKDEEYLGGAISPGIRLRYKVLNMLTANLPQLDADYPEDFIGDSTNSSIHSGVSLGVCYEIDGQIQDYKERYKDLTVILTGGDTNFLAKRLKSSIFANSRFLLQGLNNILEYNKVHG